MFVLFGSWDSWHGGACEWAVDSEAHASYGTGLPGH